MPLAISTNIAAEKANYYLGYNSDKVQESIKLGQRQETDITSAGSWKPGGINEVIRIPEPVIRSNEQRSKRNLFP